MAVGYLKRSGTQMYPLQVIFKKDSTFYVPIGYKLMDVFLVNGGEAGGIGELVRYDNWEDYHEYGGSGGNGGRTINRYNNKVFVGQEITVTIGSGGKAANGTTSEIKAGTTYLKWNDTTFGVPNGSNNFGSGGGFGYENSSSNHGYNGRRWQASNGATNGGTSVTTYNSWDGSWYQTTVASLKKGQGTPTTPFEEAVKADKSNLYSTGGNGSYGGRSAAANTGNGGHGGSTPPTDRSELGKKYYGGNGGSGIAIVRFYINDEKPVIDEWIEGKNQQTIS